MLRNNKRGGKYVFLVVVVEKYYKDILDSTVSK